jgi:hypothetical protein
MRAWLVLVAALAACSFRDGAAASESDGGATKLDGHVAVTPDAFVDQDAPAIKPVPIGFVQSTTSNTSGGMTVNAMIGAQTAHDFNLVVVSDNDALSAVFSVSDSDGNTYDHLDAIVDDGVQELDVWYAANIAGDTSGNNITAIFVTNVTEPEIRVLEYAGIALSAPLDVTAAGTAQSDSPASGQATTTHANDLVVGAECSTNSIKNPGSGFTQRLQVNGDIVEDMIVATAGSYDATAKLNSSSTWIMRLAAFAGQQ